MNKSGFFQSVTLLSFFLPLFIFIQNSMAQPATKPYWVEKLTIHTPDNYYFGIGYGDSQVKADNRARVAFSQNVRVTVQSITESYLSENGQKLRDEFKEQAKITSNMDLRGISITDRWVDPPQRTVYSLIKYSKEKYREIFKNELAAAIEKLKAQNKAKEKEELEKQRHAKKMTELEIKEKQQKDELEREKRRARKEHERHIFATRGGFIRMGAPVKMLDIKNGEIGEKPQEVSFSAAISPIDLARAEYAFYWKYFGFYLSIAKRINTIDFQESALKVQVLKNEQGLYHTSLALGINQFAHDVENFKQVDTKQWGFSLFLAGDISIPQLYLYASLFADKRKLAMGLNYFPFFDLFKGKLELIMQNELIYDPEYRNRFNDQFYFQPGIRFAVEPGFFYTTISYEKNKFITFTFDFKL